MAIHFVSHLKNSEGSIYFEYTLNIQSCNAALMVHFLWETNADNPALIVNALYNT